MVWLLDTGPLVAFLNPDDDSHQRVLAAFAWIQPKGRLVTSMPVVTEAMYFTRFSSQAQSRLVEILISSNTVIHPSNEPADLEGALHLMERYADTPMDYADASLVHLSRLTGIKKILTLDERGFRVFQPAPQVHFNLVLDDY